MKKKRKRIKLKFVIAFIVICTITLSLSIFKIIRWNIYSNKTIKQANEIEEVVEIKESNKNAEIIEQEEEIPKSDPYWDFIGYNLIYVNFDSLLLLNNDVKGWIQVSGTNINYPFVQASDNKYYLNHSFDKKYNEAGWIFMDYRNKSHDKHTILYGHSRLDNTMFGSLKYILSNGWLNNANNYVIKLSTKEENTLWQVFSVYHIPVTSDYLKTEFTSDEDFNNFTNLLINRSVHNFNTKVSATDKIITLSSCYNTDEERIVLHAKLIKKEIR